MKPKLWDPEYVFLFRVNVDIVGWAGKSWRLDQGADCSRIVALEIALESRAEAFDLPVISREFSTTSSHVHRVAPDKFFFPRIFQILPARHPGNRGIGNVVRRRRLAQKPRQVAIAWTAVKGLAQIAPELSAGICDARRPVAGLRIQHDVRSFDAGSGQHDHLGINFDFFSGSAVYKRDALRHAVLVN